MRDNTLGRSMSLLCMLLCPFAVTGVAAKTSCPDPGHGQPARSDRLIAQQRFAVQAKGSQWLGMSNIGEWSNPNHVPLWVPELEYPGESGTVFLFSGGIWVGATRDGVPIVSTTTDGDNGTNEYGPLEFATPEDQDDSNIRSVGWLEKVPGPVTQDEVTQAVLAGRYLGAGVRGIDDDGDWTLADDLNGDGIPSADWDGPEGDANGDGIFDYDPEPHVDEDPAGDISLDYIDNDHDGLVDGADPDFDGDAVVGSLDDDDDGLTDEDDLAVADQELITAYVDTCEYCVGSADPDGFTPLFVRVVQHSRQYIENDDGDSILMEFEITNIGDALLEDVCVGTFFDFDVGHVTQESATRCTDDVTYYVDADQMAVGGDNDGDAGLLQAQYFGVRPTIMPLPQVQTTYKNFSRLYGQDPANNATKYALMSSGQRDPDQWEPSDWRFVLSFGPLGDLAPGEVLRFGVSILNWPLAFPLIGTLVDGTLELTWSTVTGTQDYWVYGASNLPWFIPGTTPHYQYRIATLPSTTSTWSSPAGVGDPNANWTYLVMAVDGSGQELTRSNRVGEEDYGYDIP